MYTTNKNPFQEFEELHSRVSLLDKASKVTYLRGQWNHLNQIAGQMAMAHQYKGYFTPTERMQAQHLLDMMRSIEIEGAHAEQELRNEVQKEALKSLIQILTKG